MIIREATLDDVTDIYEIGKICFPPLERATMHEFEERIIAYPDQFWLLEDKEGLVAFINGMATNDRRITDDMFKDASLHVENGEWQAIFGVNTLPEYRKRGYAARIMEQVIADAKKQGRKGCILTCKNELISYYEKFGYENKGISQSKLGGIVWYDMRLEFSL